MLYPSVGVRCQKMNAVMGGKKKKKSLQENKCAEKVQAFFVFVFPKIVKGSYIPLQPSFYCTENNSSTLHILDINL